MTARTRIKGAWQVLPLVVGAMVAAAPAFARIYLVTLPARDATQVTIYEEADLTLVRETRTLTMAMGLNSVQFNWSGMLLDPMSLHARVLREPAAFRLLDTSFPANTADTAIFSFEADRDGSVPVELRAFASGFAWDAAYLATVNADETALRVEPWFRITNNSGSDLEDASARLVVGQVSVVERVRMLAEIWRERLLIGWDKGHLNFPDPFGGAGPLLDEIPGVIISDRLNQAYSGDFYMVDGEEQGLVSRAEFVKAAVSEYYLYSIAGTTDIANGWAAGLPNPTLPDIPVEVAYEFNPAKYGWGIVRLYRFTNDSEHKLGDVPLPQGMWIVRGDDPRGGPRFVGAADHKYAPIGEDVELNLGDDGMLLLEERTMSLSRESFEYDSDGDITGWDDRRTVEIELRNAGGRAVPVKLRMPVVGGVAAPFAADAAPMKLETENMEWVGSTGEEFQFRGATFRLERVNGNNPYDEGDDDVELTVRTPFGTQEVVIEEDRSEFVDDFEILAESVQPASILGLGVASIRVQFSGMVGISRGGRRATGASWRCEHEPCDWDIPESSEPFEKIDKSTVEWNVGVPALSKKVIAFTFVTRQGSRARAN